MPRHHIYNNFGEHQRAIEFFTKSLAIRKEVYQDINPDVANSFENLGIAYYKLGDNVKAIANFGQSLELRKALFPEPNPDVAWTLHNLGATNIRQGEDAKAFSTIIGNEEILFPTRSFFYCGYSA